MLLFFLLVGMAFGTDGVGIEFDSFATVQFIGMVALSIILFSGGMDTSFEEVRPILKEGVVFL
jgi:cell volume regulation protein A